MGLTTCSECHNVIDSDDPYRNLLMNELLEEIDRIKARCEELEKGLAKVGYVFQSLLNKVNKVTAYHRHGNKIPVKVLDELVNRQIEVEHLLQEPK